MGSLFVSPSRENINLSWLSEEAKQIPSSEESLIQTYIAKYHGLIKFILSVPLQLSRFKSFMAKKNYISQIKQKYVEKAQKANVDPKIVKQCAIKLEKTLTDKTMLQLQKIDLVLNYEIGSRLFVDEHNIRKNINTLINLEEKTYKSFLNITEIGNNLFQLGFNTLEQVSVHLNQWLALASQPQFDAQVKAHYMDYFQINSHNSQKQKNIDDLSNCIKAVMELRPGCFREIQKSIQQFPMDPLSTLLFINHLINKTISDFNIFKGFILEGGMKLFQGWFDPDLMKQNIDLVIDATRKNEAKVKQLIAHFEQGDRLTPLEHANFMKSQLESIVTGDIEEFN